MKVTLGPKGRNVVLERKFGAPTVTQCVIHSEICVTMLTFCSDGVSVAREVELMDKSDEAVKLIKEVIRKTDKEETSEQKATAEVLKEAIAKEAAKRKKT